MHWKPSRSNFYLLYIGYKEKIKKLDETVISEQE